MHMDRKMDYLPMFTTKVTKSDLNPFKHLIPIMLFALQVAFQGVRGWMDRE